MKLKKGVKILIFIACILLVLGGTFIYLVSPVSINNKDGIEVEIESGMGTEKIASTLKEKGLIKSKYLFILYVKTSGKKSLKADTYLLNKSMSLNEIVSVLESGSDYNPDMLKLTFKEGERITDYAKVIANNTNNSYDDVIDFINNKEYLKNLIDKYWFLTDKILDTDIYYPLEGYLAPDTYYFDNKDVSVEDIITTMLKQEEKRLEKYKDKIISDPHKYITMASIAELEGTKLDNKKMIVGVFNNRLKANMNLGSDVTTYYGLQVSMTSDLTSEQFNSDNKYNTRNPYMRGKLPIGPIDSPGEEGLEASINPASNDYLYFVADKHGKVYYSKTLDEHNKKISEIKNNGDWIW